MMKLMLFALAAALPLRLMAQEHPKGAEHPTEHPAPVQTQTKEHPAEHPTKAQGQEHPKGHDHAAHEHPVGSKAWTKQTTKEYNQFVKSHVKTAEKNGGLKVRDDKQGKEWNLKLVRIHSKKVVHLGDERFFACADFVPTDKADKAKVDLDFYATKEGGNWKMEEVLIHKVNGKPRFTYNSKNERVPSKG